MPTIRAAAIAGIFGGAKPGRRQVSPAGALGRLFKGWNWKLK
jgi:hypothetical protein